MNPYDKAARYAAKQLDAEGFLRWLLGHALDHWRWTGWLDAQTLPFPGEPDRRSDTIAAFERTAGDGPPAAVVVEFQARPQGDMLERLAEYVLRLRRERPAQLQPRVPYEVVGALLNLTGAPQTETWTMTPPDFGEAGLQFRVRVRTLREESATATLADIEQGRIARCILPWVPLMRGGDQAEVVEEWKRLAAAEADPKHRGDYGGLAKVFAELAGRSEVWRTGLEGWNVEVSQVVLEWQAQARVEGEARGRAEGVAQEMARGQAAALGLQRAQLLRLLEAHLKAPLPADLVALVQRQSDLMVLDRMFDQALEATTLADVRAAFGLV
ncbi:MAG TPA: hypothetical protein DDY78_12045 [Planctomycetales bacterium]|nr:hypothetical protein [Planctomycetales bacterium]